MKKKAFILTLCLAAGSLALQAQERLTQYDVRNAGEVRLPIMNDSINPKGERHSIDKLMETPVVFDLPGATVQTLSTDSTGCLRFEKPGADYRFYIVRTTVRAERFMKGTLKIVSPARWEVFVDGASRMKKNTAEDSISNASARTLPLTMEPERDYEITFKLLSAADDKATPTLACEFQKSPQFKEIGFVSGSAIKQRFALDNTVYGNRVVDVAVSPNGKYLLTRYWNNYAAKRSHIYCQLTELKSGKVIVDNVRDGMRWMPRSEKLYYTVTSSEGNNLVTLDPATLREEILLRNIPAGNFRWSPTEDYLIYFPQEEGIKETGPLRRIVSPEDRIPNTRGRSFLAKYTLATGVTQRLTYGNHSTYLQDIAPDGKRILYTTSRENITQRPYSLSSLFQVDLETLKVDTLFYEQRFLDGAGYSPDGTQLLLTASPEAFGGIGKNCGNHPIANDYDKQTFIMDLATRNIEPITKDFNPSVINMQWNRKDGNIYFLTTDGDCQSVYRYSPKDKRFEKLKLEVDVVAKFSFAEFNPEIAAYYGQSDHNAGVAYLYNLKKQESTLLADPMKPILDKIELGKTEEWNFTASDGTLITGKMCLPPAFDPNKKYPLIVYYYGGTTPTTRGISNPYCAQLFASRDYVVYVIQPSGTIGFGQEFSARHVNAWGKRTADDIIEGTKQFCKEHPFVDEKRIGCLGASYGGFMTQYLQTQTDIFAAAVSHAGISNVTSYWGEGYWGYSYNAIAAADSYPWSNPELFTKQGSLFNADKINTPLLLLHGTVDTNVPIGESIQLFNALKILGKPVELITVDGENHFISDYDKRIKWHNSIMAWFARWLQDRPEWWNELYPERKL